MPAVWEQHCYDSVLAGKAVSAEDHRLVMGWETFREFHDCYLHTDVLALADVMESYRDSFRAQSGLVGARTLQQAHDGEGLLPPHEEALPEDEAALHGHRLRDGADVQHPHGPARRRAQGEAQDQGRAEEGGDQRPASRVSGGAGGRQRAQGGLRAAAQPRTRDRRGDRREEVALPLQRQGLRPCSARLRTLRPRDGVPRGAPASGARSDTAAAAEPLLGVDCRNRKKDPELSFSRLLTFSIMLIFDPMLKEMTSSAAFRCVQAWLLEKPAAWADEDAPCLAAALMAQRPPCDMLRKRPREDALLEAERSHQRSHRGPR